MTEQRIASEIRLHPVVADRWSPFGFSDRPVSPEDLRALFEAARLAPSSYNEQPWRYLVATREDPEAHRKMAGVLVEGNRAWARHAPVLVLAVTAGTFARNGRPNGHARHDLGLATGNLLAEATARGLAVHQMGGILPEKAREVFAIPEDFDVVAAMAIGYPGTPEGLDEALREKDRARRGRRPIEELVFGRAWGEAAGILR